MHGHHEATLDYFTALALSHTVVPPESSVTIWHAHRPVFSLMLKLETSGLGLAASITLSFKKR